MARSVRVGLAFIIVANSLFLLVDLFISADPFVPFWGARVATNAVGLLLIARAKRFPLRAALAGCLITGAMLIWVIHLAGGVTGPYAPGLILLYVGIPVLLPFTPREAAVVAVPLQVASTISLFFESTIPPLGTVVVHMAFPVAAAAECIVSCALLDRIRFRDFVRRRELEHAHDQLKLLDEAKTKFTATIHHELRTPLTLILAPLDELIDNARPRLRGETWKAIHGIRRNAQRLLDLVNGLLDLAQLEAGKFTISRAPIDPTPIVREICDAARPGASRLGIRLEFEAAPGSFRVIADAQAIERVSLNLIGNAIKFTAGGGVVSVTTKATLSEWTLAVVDSGIGIAPESLNAIFDRFAHANSPGARTKEGSGIGLSVVKELVDLLAGRVWAESDGVGLGSRFYVCVPLDASLDGDSGSISSAADQPEAPQPGSKALESDVRIQLGDPRLQSAAEREVERSVASERDKFVGTGEANPIVLVIDDNDQVRELVAGVLASEGMVHQAGDAFEAIDVLASIRPDVIVADRMMPGMSGIELCKRLKADPRTRSIPYLMVTARSDRDSRIGGLDSGVDDYIGKPFDPRELRARVRSLVRTSRLQRAVEVRNSMLAASNSELARAREESDLLTRAVFHDLRSPIVAANEALRIFDERGRTGQTLALARTNLARAEEMVGGLRRLVRDSSGSEHWSDIDTSELVQEIVGEIRLRPEAFGARFFVETELPFVWAQRMKLAHVFRNLLGNTVEHARHDGDLKVSIGCVRRDDVQAFWIEDNGVGIEPPYRRQIFLPFRRVPVGHDAVGLGLGLSLVERIVMQHGGRTWVEAGRKCGARFWFEIRTMRDRRA
jgi:signal transduction histidine kinase